MLSLVLYGICLRDYLLGDFLFIRNENDLIFFQPIFLKAEVGVRLVDLFYSDPISFTYGIQSLTLQDNVGVINLAS